MGGRVKECKVLMFGTDPDGQGGIATVASVLRQQGFFERNQVRYIVTHANGTGARKLLTALDAVAALSWACLTRRPVIVHVHSACRASFFRKSLLLAIARMGGRKTVFHLHGGEFRQFVMEESGPLARWWIRHTIARSSAVITLSDSWADFLRTLVPAAKVRVIANSVALPADMNPALEEPGRILFLGRAGKAKGIFDLLAAVARLKDEFPEIMLVIGGDGDLQEVERVAEQLQVGAHVTLLGWIGQQERDSQLRRAAVFTLPSYNEGLPMSMLEAMAAGKAVVVTPVGGIPEAVQDHENGLLVCVGEVDQLVYAFRQLFSDVALRRTLGNQARATIAGRYSTDVVMTQLSQLYGELERSA